LKHFKDSTVMTLDVSSFWTRMRTSNPYSWLIATKKIPTPTTGSKNLSINRDLMVHPIFGWQSILNNPFLPVLILLFFDFASAEGCLQSGSNYL
jgi:hypothetical protein